MILVTGATGFIGRRLMQRLLQDHPANSITCLVYDKQDSELEREGRAWLETLGVRCLPVDLKTGRGLDQAPKHPDVVFHLAANTDTGSREHDVNDLGTKNLVAAIGPMRAGSRFVFTSTISASDHREFPDIAGDETSLLFPPRSEYGRKKLATEELLIDHCSRQESGLAIIRVCAVFGKGARAGGLYDALITLVRKNSILARINFPGKMTVIHVEDLVDILARMPSFALKTGQHHLVIPTGEVLSVHEMAVCIHDALRQPMREIRLPLLFWRLIGRFCDVIYAVEFMLPHEMYNKLWQLTLLVNNGYNNQSVRLHSLFPQKSYRSFRGSVGEML